jgi:hypothetical protein
MVANSSMMIVLVVMEIGKGRYTLVFGFYEFLSFFAFMGFSLFFWLLWCFLFFFCFYGVLFFCFYGVFFSSKWLAKVLIS